MTLRDLVDLAFSNLWRIKLRAALTMAGVLIAIATFVAMLSFGAGNQQYVTDQYTQFGLFTTMYVFPQRDDSVNDTVTVRLLDNVALEQLAAIPGVRLAYPFDAFSVTATVADTSLDVKVRALPLAAMQTTMLSQLQAGHSFTSDAGHEAVVTDQFPKMCGVNDPDSLVGRQIIIAAHATSLDSALLSIVDDPTGETWRRLHAIQLDSLFNARYRGRVVRRELNEAVRRFVNGFIQRQITIYDTLTIVGVLKDLRSRWQERAPIYIPIATARQLSAGGFGHGSDLTDLMLAMRMGWLFPVDNATDARAYPQVTLDLDPLISYKPIKDSVEALGFRTHSYAEQFQEIQKFFLYFNLLLSVIGLIALLTASLGIVNTMVMSIMERRKEIGILRSLGADGRDIRLLFLVESAVMGALGSIAGILSGWIATRIISAVGQAIMRHRDIPTFEPFALPIWLILVAFAFGTVVSILAGLYPAGRAARVDPVEALRSE